MPFPAIATRAMGAVPPNILAVILMVISGASYAGMAALIKTLAGEIHPLEMVFFRNLFGLVVVLPFFFGGSVSLLSATKIPLFIGRGFTQATAQTLFYFGVLMTPLAAAVTLSMAQGIFLAIGAVVFLGEPSVLRRWFAVILGLAGALLIIRPDAQILSGFLGGDGSDTRAFGAMIVALSTIGYAALSLNAKVLVSTLAIPSIITWTLLISTPLTLIGALFVWTWPTFIQLVFLFLIGGLGTCGNATMTRAFKVGDVSALAPLTYIRVVWGALFGFILFSELPDIWTGIGAALIIAAGVYLSRLEASKAST